MLRRWGDKLKALGGKKKKKKAGASSTRWDWATHFLQAQSNEKNRRGKKKERKEKHSALVAEKQDALRKKKKNVNTEEKRCLSASRPFFLERKISSSLSFFLCLLGCSAFLSASYVFACRPVSPPACLPACFPGRASLPSALSCAAVHTLSLLCSPVKWVPHGPAGCSQSLHGWQRRAADRQPKIKKNTHSKVTLTQSKGSKVTPSRPWECNRFESGLSLSQNTTTTSPHVYLPGCCVLNWVWGQDAY